jgi:hypothetical protein
MPEEKKPKLELRALKRPSPPKDKPQPQDEASLPKDEPPKAEGEVTKPAGEDKAKGKPKPKRMPPLPRPEVATNARGEEFREGDRILTRVPWLHRESRVESELLGFYESASGQVWAEYKPEVTPPTGWEGLEKGVLRVEYLQKA